MSPVDPFILATVAVGQRSMMPMLTAGFSVRGVFRSQPAPACIMALVRVLTSSGSFCGWPCACVDYSLSKTVYDTLTA